MIPRGALVLTCAFVALPPQRVACTEPFPVVTAPREDVSAAADLRLELRPTQPAVRGQNLKVRLAIVNVSDRDVSLTYDSGRWIRGYGYRGVDERGGHYTTFGESHPLFPGKEICHDPGQVFVLKPGGELVREAQVSLERAPEGRVELSVKIELIRVTPGTRCEKAQLYKGEATTEIVVQPKARRKPGPKTSPKSRRP